MSSSTSRFNPTRNVGAWLALLATISTTAGACPLSSCAAQASPILSVPDLDGNGVVDHADLQIIADATNEGYVAIFDLNADGVVDAQDKLVVQDILTSGVRLESSKLDKQLLRLYHQTKHLRNKQDARNEVFVQVSHDALGRGQEFMSSPLELRQGRDPDAYQSFINPTFIADKPDGLLYNGKTNKLAACEFNLQPDVAAYVASAESLHEKDMFSQWPEAFSLGLAHASATRLDRIQNMPSFFASADAKWRSRLGVCLSNFALSETFQGVDLDILQQHEFSSLLECSKMASSGELTFLPALSSLTVWVHSLNRCGVFAQCNPDLAPYGKSLGDVAPSEVDAKECVWMAKMSDELSMLSSSKHATAKGKTMIKESQSILATEHSKACRN
jgi:hypothetical protein